MSVVQTVMSLSTQLQAEAHLKKLRRSTIGVNESETGNFQQYVKCLLLHNDKSATVTMYNCMDLIGCFEL